MKGANSYNEDEKKLDNQYNDIGDMLSGFNTEHLDRDKGVDEFGYYPGEAEAELEAYINTNEAQLSRYTTEELYDEIFRRMFEPYQNELKKLRDKLEEMSAF